MTHAPAFGPWSACGPIMDAEAGAEGPGETWMPRGRSKGAGEPAPGKGAPPPDAASSVAASRAPPRAAARRFLAVPAEEVAFLRDTLGLYLGTPRVEEVLRLFGRRLGRSVAVLDPEAPDVAEAVCQLGAQLGLGRFSYPREEPEGPDRGRAADGLPELGTVWVLTLERLVEPMPREGRGPLGGRDRVRPVFTAGFLEGLFEGMLGSRVEGELEADEEGSWELRVRLLPRRSLRPERSPPLQLPEARAYRLEAEEGSDFFARIAPVVVPGATLGFTREPPRKLRAEYGLAGAELHWFAVTHRPGESVLPPRQIGTVVEVVESYLMRHRRPALVFLQGLDYLANRNEPRTIVRLVEIVKERVVSAGGTLVVEVPAEGLDPELLQQLRRELGEVLPDLD